LIGLAARIPGSRLGHGLGQVIPSAAFFALGVIICLLALYPGLKLSLVAFFGRLDTALQSRGHPGASSKVMSLPEIDTLTTPDVDWLTSYGYAVA